MTKPHICGAPEFSRNTTDAKERAANRFALQLLMPEEAMWAAIDAGITDVARLARAFEVSEVAVVERLKMMGAIP